MLYYTRDVFVLDELTPLSVMQYFIGNLPGFPQSPITEEAEDVYHYWFLYTIEDGYTAAEFIGWAMDAIPEGFVLDSDWSAASAVQYSFITGQVCTYFDEESGVALEIFVGEYANTYTYFEIRTYYAF